MTAWADYTTGERIKALRGLMTQEALAEVAGVSVHLVRKAEQSKSISLPYLIKLSEALGTDVSIVLGEQSPRRAMARDERAALRAISIATHEAGGGFGAGVEPGELTDLQAAFDVIWRDYWNGSYNNVGAVLPRVLAEAHALSQDATGHEQEKAAALLCDAFQLSAHYANNLSARDLAYAATMYGKKAAAQASDEMRDARMDALLSWVYLRDGKPGKGVVVAEQAAARIEPRFSDSDTIHLAVYGNLMANAAVAASRGGASDQAARDYLSHAHAVAARMGTDVNAFGAIFGPTAAVTQSVSVSLALDDIGQALGLVRGARLDPNGVLASGRARYHLDIGLLMCQTRQFDKAVDAIRTAHETAPAFTRIQALTTELLRRLAESSTANVRRLAATVGVPVVW